MSNKLADLRLDVFVAAVAFEADRIVAKRDALFAAVAQLKGRTFFVEDDEGQPAVHYYDGRGIEARRWCLVGRPADAADLTVALNDKLATGWVPAS